jgi:hypothetical protein
MPMGNDLGPAISRIAGRPENGRWLHLAAQDPGSGAVELHELREQGGRMNPPASFPTAYLAEDTRSCRTLLDRWIRQEDRSPRKLVLLVLDVHLPKVLDLGCRAARSSLGITLSALEYPAGWICSQEIGRAAYQEGFSGIVCPRPYAQGGRNLAFFCDRTSDFDVSVVGLHELVNRRFGRRPLRRRVYSRHLPPHQVALELRSYG